jgi:hypothetical protein
VAHYLSAQGLQLSNVLFDGTGQLAQHVGSMALPTTVFYSAEGRLIGSHLGELSRASLTRYLDSFSSTATPSRTLTQ